MIEGLLVNSVSEALYCTIFVFIMNFKSAVTSKFHVATLIAVGASMMVIDFHANLHNDLRLRPCDLGPQALPSLFSLGIG